jgi:hypothetical protein
MNRDDIPSDAPKSGRVSAWLSEIEKGHYRDDMDKYDKRCEVIRKRYRYEGSALIRTREYQLLWSNIETMKSAVYSKPPHGTVSRRYRDADPVGRVACEILERAINFTFDVSDFDGVFKQVRDDFLGYARGVARIYYEPEYETEDDLNEDIEDAEDISAAGIRADRTNTADGGGKPKVSRGSSDGDRNRAASDGDERAVSFENVRIRFVQRSDFRHQAARTWEEVQWVAFRAFLTRAEVTERFGEEIGDSISLDSNPVDVEENERPASTAGAGSGAKATVWEIWDKAKNNVLWIAKSWPDVLEEGEPYLVLDGFYPCPRPAYGTLTTDSLVPIPDYIFYQDQAEEINQLTARIGGLSDALKLVGFYPAGPQGEGAPEVEKAMSSGFENKLIAVQSWDMFRQGGSNGGPPIIWVPIEQVASVLEACVKLRQQLLEDVYQIIGISDIMRGATDPQETEGAQQLKAQYGGTRVRDRQQEIARFCRDIARLCGQVIATYCSPATIEKMTNVKLPTAQDVLMARLKWQAGVQQAQYAAMMQGMQNGQSGSPGIPGIAGQIAVAGGPNGSQPPPGNGSQYPAAQPSIGPSPAQSPAAPPNLGPTQEDVFGLLRDSLSRRFKIDIENDSTIAGDESQEKQDRTQFIESVTKFMETWGPMVIQKPELAPLAAQLLLFGVRAFRIGRELEEVVEETAEKLSQSGATAKGPDPKVQAEQVKLQGTQAKTQAEIQKSALDGQTAQQAAAAKMQETQMDSAAKIQELRMKLALAEQQHQHKLAQGQMEHGAAMDKMALEHQKAQTAQVAQAAKPPTWPVNESGF